MKTARRRTAARHLALPAALFLLTACAGPGETTQKPETPVDLVQSAAQRIEERGGRVDVKDAHGDSATRLVYLSQGWSPAESVIYYHTDQGSLFMPYDMLLHLEQAGSTARLADPENMQRLRFLNQRRTPNNPDALPVGFTRHGDQAGFTCAACHTAQINYRGTAMRIDGAPALIDMGGFFHDVEDAVAATLADPAKLGRYASSLQGGDSSPAQAPSAAHVDVAKKSLQETLTWMKSYNTANKSTTVEGFGRTDAIGRILNQLIRFTSDPKNSLEPNAPASYPLLWDAPRHDYVQWTGFSPNADAGSVGRNAGEVLGAFGRIEVKHYETELEAKKGYPSTVQGHALVAMEESLRRLSSPQWPEDILPPIDRALAARGEALYKQHCISCHALIDRADPRRTVTAIITGVDVVGTDDTAAKNLYSANPPSGILQGAISMKGDKYGATIPGLALLADLAGGALAAQPLAALQAIANAKLHGQSGETKKQGKHTASTDKDPSADLMSYKARPLNGVWASSPFLHNGSVPSLYDLLLPVAQRPAKFSVGRWEYDPKKVGYVSDGTVPFVLDTAVKGNSNRGHEYGVKLSDEDRWALVEYLKTL